MKLWQRYLFGHLIRTFCFIFLCFLILYAAIDFSIQGVRFPIKEGMSWDKATLLYLKHFAQLTDLFLSFSYLLSCLKVLTDLNTHRELCALQTAGISIKKILSPFFQFAFLLTLICYANSEWISPESETYSHKSSSRNHQKVFSLELEDGSELIYQKYLPQKKELFDLFWIRSFNELWHIKYLDISLLPPTAKFADVFVKNSQGIWEKKESFDLKLLSDLPWKQDALLSKWIKPENRPLSTLYKQTISDGAEKSKSAAHLHYKLAIPLVSVFLLLVLFPFALRFSRNNKSFALVAIACFIYLAFRTLLDAMLILSENQVLSPIWAIWTPYAACIALFFFSRFRYIPK